MGRFSTFCASAARGAPHWQHDSDAAVTHGRTPVERSAHRAPSEARPSHVVSAEQVGRGGLADTGAASRPPFKPPLGAAHVCWQRQATEERVAGAGGVIWGDMAGLSMDSTSGPSVWARAAIWSGYGRLSWCCFLFVRRMSFWGARRAEAATRPRAASARDPAAFAPALTTMLATPPGRGMAPSDSRLVVRWCLVLSPQGGLTDLAIWPRVTCGSWGRRIFLAPQGSN